MWCNLILLISANINLVDSVSRYCLASFSAAAAQFSLSQFTAPGFSVQPSKPGWLVTQQLCHTRKYSPEKLACWSASILRSCSPELTWILSTFASLDEAEDEQDEQQQHNRTHDTDEPALRRKAWLHLRHAFSGNKEQKKGCLGFVWGAGVELFRKKRKE